MPIIGIVCMVRKRRNVPEGGLLSGSNAREEVRVSRRLTFGFFVIGVVMVSVTWLSIYRIDHRLDGAANPYGDTLYSLLKIRNASNQANQKLFAYLLRRDEAELAAFREMSKEINREAARFSSFADLTGNGSAAMQAFSTMQDNWSDFQVNAESLIADFRAGGEDTETRLTALQQDMNAFSKQLDSLIEDEQKKIMLAQTQRDALIQDSETFLLLVAAATALALFAVGFYLNRQTRRQMQRQRELEEDLLLKGAAVESTNVGVVITRADGDQEVTFTNEAFLAITGYSEADFIGHNCRFLQGERTNKDEVKRIGDAIRRGDGVQALLLNYHKDGSEFWNELFISPVHDEQGNVTHFAAAMHDVTERVDLESRAFRSQKMEAIGQLAGGVAHDFNNYLTVIEGSADLIASHGQSENAKEHAEQIMAASRRAADLTQHLLAFSRRQVMMPANLDLNRVILDLDPLLRRTLGESISLETVTAGGLGLVNADRSQIEQVLLNLVVNARDAMPTGGSITIETGNVYLDDEYTARKTEIDAGRYVMIAVSDSGTGIEKEVLPRIFEPFFTTKETGGSGLGLSTVQGIVEQSGGTVQVYSEAASGTTFKVYLPRVTGEVAAHVDIEPDPEFEMSGKVLVVEDQDMVREITCQMVRALGFEVLEAKDGVEGLEIAEREAATLDVILTDVMLPRLGGRQMADRVTELFPDIRILFMSGYTENGIQHQGRLDPGVELLQKPFTQADVRRKLIRVLSRKD